MPYRIQDPVLNIYVGTSPSMVGRHVNRELRHLPDTERRKVTSLFIDTMQLREELLNGMRTPGADTLRMNVEPYQGSGAWGDQQVRNMFVKTGGEPDARMHKPGITVAGAGGVRSNGHFTFCFWSKRIRQRLIEKINQINAPPQDVQDDRPAATLRINIIAFLGGGTGSGLLPSLALLTRYVLKEKGITPMTAIYGVLPEHPRGQTADMQRRQRSNAFATLVELTSLFELSKRPEPHLWHLGELSFDMSSLQIVDVVYLYGHGLLSSHEPLYEHIAMDLVTRIQNGHGAGAERHRMLPDLFCLSQQDQRDLPTFVATSGVTEIIFPRQEIIEALARRAARAVLESQSHALPERQRTSTEQVSNELAKQILDRLGADLHSAQIKHAPEPADIGVIYEGEAFWELLQARIGEYRERLRYSRDEIHQVIEEECTRLIHAEVHQHHEAIFDRRVKIYQELAQRVSKALDDVPTLQGAAHERDTDLEDRSFRPSWLPWRRVGPAHFADYVESLQTSDVEAANVDNLREALGRLRHWLKQQEELSRQNMDVASHSALHQSANDLMLVRGGLLTPHPYRRAALRDAALVDRLYHDLLEKNRLLGADGALNIMQTLLVVQSQNGSRQAALSRESLEAFFERCFAETIAQNYSSVLDMILILGGETLLRDHLHWALNYALPHLQYHPYQEPETNGRIARQIDVAMRVGTHREYLQTILDQESTRAEAQDGLQLHDSLDPDRITVLYTEYGIALRAIKGMHEASDSYLDDYQASQRNWRSSASLPVHASTLMQTLAAQPFAQGQPLAQLFSDEPTQVQPQDLYGPAAAAMAGVTP